MKSNKSRPGETKGVRLLYVDSTRLQQQFEERLKAFDRDEKSLEPQRIKQLVHSRKRLGDATSDSELQ